jgi:Tol biopolymer transport system component/tRNA A-37 threonylcarbamoyl transferase component Bud32
MALQPGTTLGPYEILELAGAGGMGEVYKARDTRLDRTVAIKVLPPHASASAESKQRFEREAQAIAALNHPNICVLHDIGRESGIDFIVMEYLEGETLADRLARTRTRSSGASAAGASRPASSSAGAATTGAGKTGITATGRALKIDTALDIAIQIAEALSRAHQHGVIHRDLKPANVMLLSAGGGSQSAVSHVKLLDFGLAKLTSPDDAIASANTGQADLTGPGVVLGTVRYMSPEQVDGRPVDARTDIFAFGAVLYEMLTGRQAFEGKTQSSLIAAIVNVDPPPLSVLMPIAPRALERLVMRCLAKEPNDRWQSAHDLLLQLRWIARGAGRGNVRAITGGREKRQPWALAALGAALLVTAAMALPAYRYFAGPTAQGPFRFRIPAVGLSSADMAISPDGEMIVFAARPGTDSASLWIRPVNAVTFRRLEGTENATQPFWSPDSSTIGFVASGRLKKVAASGTPPQELGPIDGSFYGGSWGTDGTILFGSAKGVRRISSEGGTAETITTLDKTETGHYWPYFLPDGRHFLFSARSAQAGQQAIYASSVDSQERTRVLSEDSNAQFASGYLLFRREATVLAQPFDPSGLQLSGGPSQVAGDVGYNLTQGRGYFSVDRRGTLIYFQGVGNAAGLGRAGITPNWQFGWHDRTGRLIAAAGDPGSYGDADVGPDEKLFAITRQDPGAAGSDIWVIDTGRDVSTKLTLDPADDLNPVWARDGKRIAFTSFRKGNADIYVKNANGVGAETALLDSPADEFVEDWSEDGRYIAYKHTQGDFEDLYALPLDADGKPGTPIPLVQGPFRKDEPQFSSDGKWIAYTSDESGRFEVYVASFPELDQKIKVSNNGGGRPRWRRDARELYYNRTASGVMAVDFMPGPKIAAGIPYLLYSNNAPAGADPTRHLFDASADGQRFFARTASSIAGGVQGAVPTVPSNFVAPGQAQIAAGAQVTVPNPNLAASNGLTVIRNWPATFRKGAR